MYYNIQPSAKQKTYTYMNKTISQSKPSASDYSHRPCLLKRQLDTVADTKSQMFRSDRT